MVSPNFWPLLYIRVNITTVFINYYKRWDSDEKPIMFYKNHINAILAYVK